MAEGALDYAIAALRECFEEVGLLLLDTEVDAAAAAPWRDRLQRGDAGAADFAQALGVRWNLQGLAYHSHWLTPPGTPKRFDTRFFAALAPAGQQAEADYGEAVELMWLTPAEALASERALKLLPVTRRTLQDLGRFARAADALAEAQARAAHPADDAARGPLAPWRARGRAARPVALRRDRPPRPHGPRRRLQRHRRRARGAAVAARAARHRAQPGRDDRPRHQQLPGRCRRPLGRHRPRPRPRRAPCRRCWTPWPRCTGASRASWSRTRTATTPPAPPRWRWPPARRCGGAWRRIRSGRTRASRRSASRSMASASRSAPGVTLRVLHTPGHASNHLCYLLEEEKTLFTGDHVMQGSTVVINPPDGDMAAYLRALQALLDEDLDWLAPGHGFLVDQPHAVLRALIAHRLRREARVRDALRAGRRGQPGRPRAAGLRRRAAGAAPGGAALAAGAPAEAAGRRRGRGRRRALAQRGLRRLSGRVWQGGSRRRLPAARRAAPGGAELGLVGHLRALRDPVAQVDVRQLQLPRLLDLPQHAVGAVAGAAARVRRRCRRPRCRRSARRGCDTIFSAPALPSAAGFAELDQA